jgi:2-polyprenyl-3-methyl-5-hydroxy-6-metoxy-1,4-benzoquinol methylase
VMNEWKDANGILHSGKNLNPGGSHTVIACQNCGFIHKIPLPTQKEYDEFYLNFFYDQDDKSSYLDYSERDIDYRRNLHHQKLKNLGFFFKNTKKRRMLDIGSGGGIFIEYMTSHGWNCEGVEPSRKAFEYANSRKRKTHHATIENYIESFSGEKYDVVHLRAVLDNLLDPKKIISDISDNLLKDSGIIIIDTPNEFNPFQEVLVRSKNIKRWWLDGDGINFFNKNDLENLLSECNFNCLLTEGTFPLEIFMLFSNDMDYLSNSEVGQKIHSYRVNFENMINNHADENLLSEFYRALAKINLGRYIISYAQKR